MSRPALAALVFSALAVAACGGEPQQAPTPNAQEEPPPPVQGDASAPAAPMPMERHVVIATPSEGDTVDGPEITVRLEAIGFQVVPAGDTTSNSGHLHIFLDRDLSEAGVPIPAEENFIIHMGTGATETTLPVEPGEHRLIAVVGDATHMPLQPWVTDTVHFVVRGGM